jgi:hypothetical protein
LTMALILALNGVAVAGLLGLLMAVMRLPYRLPSSPRGEAAAPRAQGAREMRNPRPHRDTPDRRDRPEPVYSR